MNRLAVGGWRLAGSPHTTTNACEFSSSSWWGGGLPPTANRQPPTKAELTQ